MIATTQEQSQRLLRCGVSADTADMCYDSGALSLMDYNSAVHERDSRRESYKVAPAWSLSALLSLLPKEITVKMEFYDVDRLACLHISSTNEKWYVSYKYEFEEREYWCKMFNSEELIDALYKLMIWVIAHNHVKLD